VQALKASAAPNSCMNVMTLPSRCAARPDGWPSNRVTKRAAKRV